MAHFVEPSVGQTLPNGEISRIAINNADILLCDVSVFNIIYKRLNRITRDAERMGLNTSLLNVMDDNVARLRRQFVESIAKRMK